MTYQELKEKLEQLTEEQLLSDVIVFDTNEQDFVYGIEFVISPSKTPKVNHPYFIY